MSRPSARALISGIRHRGTDRLIARLSRSQASLRIEAETAVAADDGRAALPALLELDDRFPADAWVLESLAGIHRWLRLPERGLAYVRRHRELTGSNALAAICGELENEQERWSRNQSRLANIRQQRPEAVEHALVAASVTEPSTWTLRVLTEAAIASGDPSLAAPAVARVRAVRPDDELLEQLDRQLNG